MLSKPISAKVVFALALAMLMAWSGHTSALFTGASQSVQADKDPAHSHAHHAYVCAACTDHFHSSLTADHLHETPHLSSLLSLDALSEGRMPMQALHYFFPPGPLFLIERPPRTSVIL